MSTIWSSLLKAIKMARQSNTGGSAAGLLVAQTTGPLRGRAPARKTQGARLAVEELESRCVPARVSPLLSHVGWRAEQLEVASAPGARIAPFRAADFSNADATSILVSTSARQSLQLPSFMSRFVSGVTSLMPGIYQVHLAAGVQAHDAANLLRNLPGVEHVEPNQYIQITARPNDPLFSQQWALANPTNPGADIHAVAAWDINTRAANIVVAVIDSGIDYTHPDLSANMWRNPGEIPNNGIDDDNNGYVDDVYGYDFGDDDADPYDDNGHGTHVAGTIGAVGNNAIGVTGVAWNVRLMALKFLDDQGSGTEADAVRAIDYAIRMGARIINASWGGYGYSTILAQAISRAERAGVLFVAAAGNETNNNDTTPCYPASYPNSNIIAVAATDANDNLAWFSNFGPRTVHIAAPGDSILSTWPNGQYRYLDGTSMAAPHVSGAAALLWALHPDWSYRQVKDQLLQSVDVLSSLQGKILTGGRLNLAKALAASPARDTIGPRVVDFAWLRDSGGIFGFRVTFNETISSLSANAISLRGPNGNQIRITSIRRISDGPPGSVFEVRFARQTTSGTYRVEIGPNVTDLAGNPMDQDGDGTPGEIPQDRYTNSTSLQRTYVYNTNVVNVPIRDFSTIRVPLVVPDNIRISELRVKVDIRHTYVGDLVVSLISPTGQRVVLANRRGGSGDDFRQTMFSDDAAVPVSQGRAPFSGSYRPEQRLSAFRGQNAAGTWTLEVRDEASLDTGKVVRWALHIAGQPSGGGGGGTPVSQFNITLHLGSGLTSSQQAIFQQAARRWEQIIVGDLPDVTYQGQLVDDVLIDANAVPIDGPGGILGQAGRDALRPRSSYLPIHGPVVVDTADLARLEADGRLLDVILHEMGHALGLARFGR